ncbi:Alkaline phosphatase, partial [Paramuricea clavata]
MTDISQTWVCETLDGIATKYIRKWLELPISATLSNVYLPYNKFGLNVILPSTKFIQCQTVSRSALKSSINENIRELWSITSTNRNIQYDIYSNAKDVLKAFRQKNEQRLQNNLMSQGSFFSNIVKNSTLAFNSLWSSVHSKLPKNIFNFSLRYINNSLPTRKNLVKWGLSSSADCPFCFCPESLLHVISGCKTYLNEGRYTWRHNSVLNLVASSLLDVERSKMYVDLPGFISPSVITGDELRPDLLLTIENKILYILELTVGFETNLKTNSDRKHEKSLKAIIAFRQSVYETPEDRNALLEIELASGKTAIPVIVSFSTSPNTADARDFVPEIKNVTFAPGEAGPKQVSIGIIDDSLVEPTEDFKVSMRSSVTAVKAGGTSDVKILDNDEVLISFVEGSYDVKEDEDAVIEVELSSGDITEPVTVTLTTEPLTAGDKDYVPRTVNITFQPGETGPKSMTIQIIDDHLVEPTEEFKVNLVSSSVPGVRLGEPTSVNIHLQDNDDAIIGFTKSAYNVIESEDAEIEIGFSSGQASHPVTVTLETVPVTASENDDYIPRRVNVTIEPGKGRTRTVKFDIVDDNLVEATEEFKVAVVSSSVPAVTWGDPLSVNILDNDEVVVGFTKPVYVAKEDEKATVEVQLASGQSSIPITVRLQMSPVTAGSGDYSGEPIEITFQPGETGPKSINIDLVDDQVLEDTEKFTVFLTSSTPGVKVGKPATVRILDNEVAPICNTPQDDCHRYATCTDTGPGEYSCKCNEGYTGDGKTCIAINVCETGQDDCHSNATCISTGPGTNLCSCNEGFTGDGKTCAKLPPVAGQCRKMDLILVLDRSASINRDDYEHMRHFLLSIGKSLKIGERNKDGEVIGQGAIVTFSEEGTLRISLKESQSPGKFAQVVQTMPGPLPGGRTKTHKGLDVADKEAVTSEAGLRINDPKVEKIFMVITDGEQTVESKKR